MKNATLVITFALILSSSTVMAKGGSHSGAATPGTGSKSTSTHVNGYVKKDGTYIAPHSKSTPDKTFENNWTTKGNENPTTGTSGSRVNEPKK